MIIYPAIDLIEGKCVRLYQGDFSATKTYNISPLDVVGAYKDAKAEWVHIVDLDGARNPQNRQIVLIKSLVEKSGLKVQTGGGIRMMGDIEMLMNAGVERVVIGSMAVQNIEFVKQALQRFGGETVCVAVDVIPDADQPETYNVVISGWQENSNKRLEEMLSEFKGSGLKHILCTDVSRDGTLAGSNISLYRMLKKTFPELKVQASGGVSGLQDIISLRDVETDGIIVGKALYENKIDLKEALELASC